MKISWYLKDGEDSFHLFDTEGDPPRKSDEVYVRNDMTRGALEEYRNGDLQGIAEYPKTKFVVIDSYTSISMSDMTIDRICEDIPQADLDAARGDISKAFELYEKWAQKHGFFISGLISNKRTLMLTRQRAEVTIEVAKRSE